MPSCLQMWIDICCVSEKWSLNFFNKKERSGKYKLLHIPWTLLSVFTSTYISYTYVFFALLSCDMYHATPTRKTPIPIASASLLYITNDVISPHTPKSMHKIPKIIVFGDIASQNFSGWRIWYSSCSENSHLGIWCSRFILPAVNKQ